MDTLIAKRNGTSVEIYDIKGDLKATFPNTGYRPTKATKEISLNCVKYKVVWLDHFMLKENKTYTGNYPCRISNTSIVYFYHKIDADKVCKKVNEAFLKGEVIVKNGGLESVK